MISDLIDGIVGVTAVVFGLFFTLLLITSPIWFIFGLIYLLK